MADEAKGAKVVQLHGKMGAADILKSMGLANGSTPGDVPPEFEAYDQFTDTNSMAVGRLVLGGEVKSTTVRFPLRMANRHGLIAGATGTGKTKTLQVLAESFAAAGVPVFVADLKGDLSGIGIGGEATAGVIKRAKSLGTDWEPWSPPTRLWSLTGKGGRLVQAQLEQFGPILLSRILGLSEVQSSVLSMVFKVCSEIDFGLYTLEDLRSIVPFFTKPGVEKIEERLANMGGISASTLGVIHRKLIEADQQGMTRFFAYDQTDVRDFLEIDEDGIGIVNVLDLTDVQESPKLFSTAMLWLLREFYKKMPEAGDLDQPNLAFFFDEAHLLFRDASATLLEQVENTVRLIRSKGVGVYFITQSAMDVPEDILAQLSNRIQHAVRATTPKDRKAVRLMAENFAESNHYDVEKLLTGLAIGDALVSFLGPDGSPLPTSMVRVRPPQSRMGPLTPEERAEKIEEDKS